jgi:hypothetical protein
MTQVREGQDDGELAASPARRLLWVWMGLAGAAAMVAQAEAEMRALAVPPAAQLVQTGTAQGAAGAPRPPPQERVRLAGGLARPPMAP